MQRRDFLQLAGAGALTVPMFGRPVAGWNGALTPIATADKKQLADTALTAARGAGARASGGNLSGLC